ncbi:hypothetical protein TNCV_2968781 [Trichonephila clavipes]|nr:hypothetical protein TNCV_2968781 [Trichonephila clavipes]
MLTHSRFLFTKSSVKSSVIRRRRTHTKKGLGWCLLAAMLYLVTPGCAAKGPPSGLGPDKSRQDDLKYRKIREETNGMNFKKFFRTSDCIENDTTMEDDSFRVQKFLVIKKISTPCEWISTMRQLIAVKPDSADRKPVDTGSYTRWNHAYGSVHRGTDPQNRFQSREIMDSHINRT